VRAALFPLRRKLFAFLYETFGVVNSFSDFRRINPREIVELGLEKNICEKKVKGIGIKRKAEHPLLETADSRAAAKEVGEANAGTLRHHRTQKA